jgi:ABC-type cobalamin/Fe3+-siderophores transport system ATPase subunit
VVVLERGRVRADGPASSVLDEALLADVFRVRALVTRSSGGAIEHIVPVEALSSVATRNSKETVP